MNIYKKKDKVNIIKIFCKKNYKIIIIIIFILHQSIRVYDSNEYI